MDGSDYSYVRKFNKPEVRVDENTDLGELLSEYEGETIGLIRVCDKDRIYYQGELIIIDTEDDKRDSVKDYWVRIDDYVFVPINLGDGIFLDELPTQPRAWSPKYN
jgi:hypothetical protein